MKMCHSCDVEYYAGFTNGDYDHDPRPRTLMPLVIAFSLLILIGVTIYSLRRS